MNKPFLKWAGGKSKLLPYLLDIFPKNASRFIEPFLGAGSVSLNVDYPCFVVNDINSDLINIWKFIKKEGMLFWEDCAEIFAKQNNSKNKFLELREEFNTTKDLRRRCILFIYLNKHCFNGLCRYNKSGNFNVPYGNMQNPSFPFDNFEIYYKKTKKFRLNNTDFRDIFKLVQANDLIYCDPPYVGLSETANFDKYTPTGFSNKDQYELADLARSSADMGAMVVLSNNHNEELTAYYKKLGGTVHFVDVKRLIGASSQSRNAVKEVIVTFGNIRG